MEKHIALSLKELKEKRGKLIKKVTTNKQNLSLLDKLAVWITDRVGSMGFFVLIFIWTAAWLGWNMLAPDHLRFDPYPAFVLWLFISNMIQLFLLPLIMIGQNIQTKHSDSRAEADFKINTQAELEIETILVHLEYQNKIILKILEDIHKKD